MFLQRRDQRVANLVVGHDALFGVGQDGALLLRARDDKLKGRQQILLVDSLAPHAHGAQRRLVDEVGKVCTDRARSRLRDLVQVDILGQLDIFCVDAQRLVPSGEIGPVDDDTAVKAARAQQRLIEDLRPVRRSKDHDALARIKAVDLGQQLVERLLTLVVAAEFGISRAADGVDLINKDDSRGDLRRLLEQIAHAACADADEHFHEIGAGNGEERNACLARDGLGQKRLAGARRADQQCALRELRADGGVFLRVMQEIDDLHERFLGLVLSGHIGKRDAGGLFHIDLGLALADAADAAAHALRHAAHEKAEQGVHDDDRQQPCDDKGHDGAGLLDDLGVVFHALRVEPVFQIVIRNVGDIAGVIKPLLRRRLLGLVARQDDHAVGLELQLGDLVLVEIRLELVIGDLRQIRVGNGRIERIDKQRRDQRRDHQEYDPSALPSIVAVLRLIVLRFFVFGVVIQETHLPSVKTWEVLVGNFLLQILSHSPRIYKEEPAPAGKFSVNCEIGIEVSERSCYTIL